MAVLPALCATQGTSSDRTTDVRVDSVQPAGVPIMLTVRLTNIGDKPIYYAPTVLYPPAGGLVARITDPNGQIRESPLSNDADAAFSGPGGSIEPGAFVDVPVMLEPLRAGSYTVQVGSGKSVQLMIKDDAPVAAKWEQDLVGKIRKGDRFALYVASSHLSGKDPRASLVDGLLKELLSDDEKVAYHAAWPLHKLHELPSNATPTITKALNKHLGVIKQRGSGEPLILHSLAGLAAKIGTDEALESVLTLARTKPFRGNAIWALSSFKQEKAARELRAFLKDESEELRFRTGQRLAERKDPAALDVLLAVARDQKSRWRKYSFDALLNYRDDPRVEQAIKSALNDADSFVRESAEFALRQLRRAKKS